MKQYETPKIEVLKFRSEDVMIGESTETKLVNDLVIETPNSEHIRSN